jgi:hypothetical protein
MLTCNQLADVSAPLVCGPHTFSTTGFKIALKNPGGNYRDAAIGSVLVFGSDEAYTAPPPAYDPWTNDPDYNYYPPGTVIP